MSTGPPLTPLRLLLVIGFATAALMAVGLLDQRREAADSLAEMRSVQRDLATAVAAYLSEQVRASSGATDSVARGALQGLHGSNAPGDALVLLAPPESAALVTGDGRVVPGGIVRAALARGDSSVTLQRDDSVAFGLPRRMSIAGLSRFEAPGGTWGVVTLTSARHFRDRTQRAAWRFGLTAGLVAAAGIGALVYSLRRQRTELELAGRLRVEEMARERDQQLLRADKMATLAALSTGIAHEVATPLAVIDARLEQLLRREPQQAPLVQAVLDQTERIERVVRGFLALARGDAPTVEIVAARRLVDRATGLVRHRFDEERVTLEIGRVAALNVACDPPLFEQALANLLLNACDASAPGARVSVSVEAANGRARFVVEDAGAGLTSDEAERAVAPFHTTKTHGTGLGLTIAGEIARHHGGELRLGPRPDARGARATLELAEAAA